MSSFNLNLTIEIEKIEQTENININYNEFILNCKYFNQESQISLKKYPTISDKFFFNLNNIKTDVNLLINLKNSISNENLGLIDFFIPFFFIRKRMKKFVSQKFELKIDEINKEKFNINNNNNDNFFINFYFNIFLDYKNVYSHVSNFNSYYNLKKKPFDNVFTKNNLFIYMQNFNENISNYFNEIINYSKYSKNNSQIESFSEKNKTEINKNENKNENKNKIENKNENKNEISLSKNSIEKNNNNKEFLTLQNESHKNNKIKKKPKKNKKNILENNNNFNTLNNNKSKNENINSKIKKFSTFQNSKTLKNINKKHISDSHLEIYHDINFLNTKNSNKNNFSRKNSLIKLIPERKKSFFNIKKQKSLILKTLNKFKLEENHNKSHNNSLSNKSNKSEKKNLLIKNIECDLNFNVSTDEKIINEEIYKNNTLFIKINKNIKNIKKINSISILKQNIINSMKLFLNNHKLMSIKLLKQKKIENLNKKKLISNSQNFYEISKKKNKFLRLKNKINYSNFITNTINQFQNKIALKILESSSKELNFSKDLFKIRFNQKDKEKFDTIQKTNKLSEKGKIRLLLVSIRKCVEKYGNISQILDQNEDAQIRLKAVFYKYNIKETDVKNVDEDDENKNRFKLKEIDKINAIEEVNEEEESDFYDKNNVDEVIRNFCNKNIIKFNKLNDDYFIIKGIKVKCFFNENKKITFQFDNNNFNIEEFKNYLD